MSIGQRVRRERKKRGITQRQLGELANLGPNRVCRIEKEYVDNPSSETIISICRALDVSADVILGLKPPDDEGKYAAKYRV